MYTETQAERYALLSAVLTAATIRYTTALLESTLQLHYIGNPTMLARLERLNADRLRALDLLDKFAATDDISLR